MKGPVKLLFRECETGFLLVDANDPFPGVVGAGKAWAFTTIEEVADCLRWHFSEAKQPSIVISGNEECSFLDCPPGLFLFEGRVCFKSEYSSGRRQPDAYCIDSGEYFWGGTNGDVEARLKLTVTPVKAAAGK